MQVKPSIKETGEISFVKRKRRKFDFITAGVSDQRHGPQPSALYCASWDLFSTSSTSSTGPPQWRHRASFLWIRFLAIKERVTAWFSCSLHRRYCGQADHLFDYGLWVFNYVRWPCVNKTSSRNCFTVRFFSLKTIRENDEWLEQL